MTFEEKLQKAFEVGNELLNLSSEIHSHAAKGMSVLAAVNAGEIDMTPAQKTAFIAKYAAKKTEIINKVSELP